MSEDDAKQPSPPVSPPDQPPESPFPKPTMEEIEEYDPPEKETRDGR